MEKVSILKKIQVTMKPLTPPFVYRFSWSLKRNERVPEKKRTCCNESHENETTEAVVHRCSSK